VWFFMFFIFFILYQCRNIIKMPVKVTIIEGNNIRIHYTDIEYYKIVYSQRNCSVSWIIVVSIINVAVLVQFACYLLVF